MWSWVLTIIGMCLYIISPLILRPIMLTTARCIITVTTVVSLSCAMPVSTESQSQQSFYLTTASAPILMFRACSYCLLATAQSIRTFASDMSLSIALEAGER